MIGVGTFKITDRARRYVNEVLNSERLSYGYFTQKFENVFAAAHDCHFGVMTNSGTSCLQIALAALKTRYGWKDGDEVIVPAVTFVATSNIVIQNRMKPVFVDVDPDFYELDPQKIEAALTSRTRCIIPVHLFGCPCDMRAITQIALEKDLRIIEDSCETMFTRLNGKSVGSFGDIGCFSTYMAHILTTGVGGLCTTNDPELAVQLRSLMNHGRDSIYLSIDDDKNKTLEEKELIIKKRFSFVQMGYSYRVTEMEGALGLAEFEDHHQMMKKRRENAAYFMEKLKPFADRIQLPKIRPGGGHAFMMFPVVLRNEKKDKLVSYLEENGVETRDMLPLINQPFYKELFHIKEEDFPVARWINESGFYFASHQGLSGLERDYIVDLIEHYFKKGTAKRDRACLVLVSSGCIRAAEITVDSLPIASFDDLIFVTRQIDRDGARFFKRRNFKVLENSSKGSWLQEAIKLTDCEHITLMGTEGGDPEDISSILIKLKQGNDLVIASRFVREKKREKLISSGPSALLNRLFGYHITDCDNLFRGFRKSAFAHTSFVEAGENAMLEMTTKAVRLGLRITECATKERPTVAVMKQRFSVLRPFAVARILLSALLQDSPGRPDEPAQSAGGSA